MTNCKPSSQAYFDNLFQNSLLGCCDQICILPCKVTVIVTCVVFSTK